MAAACREPNRCLQLLDKICAVSSLRVLGYVRCSSQEQATEGMSLETQASRIRAWCELHDAELAELVEDGGVSGGRALADRPGGAVLASLLKDRNPWIEAIVVVRLDRLGRDAAETLALLKLFRKGKVGLVSILDRLDLTSPQGRAMAGVSAVFAQLERELIAQRTAEALTELRNQGRVYGPT